MKTRKPKSFTFDVHIKGEQGATIRLVEVIRVACVVAGIELTVIASDGFVMFDTRKGKR